MFKFLNIYFGIFELYLQILIIILRYLKLFFHNLKFQVHIFQILKKVYFKDLRLMNFNYYFMHHLNLLFLLLHDFILKCWPTYRMGILMYHKDIIWLSFNVYSLSKLWTKKKLEILVSLIYFNYKILHYFYNFWKKFYNNLIIQL